MSGIPEFGSDISVSDFVSDLRNWLFSSQTEAEPFLDVDRTTISRYENGASAPPRGYIARLAQLIAEQLEREGQTVEDLQGALLRDVNKACRKLQSGEDPFKTWGELCKAGDTYMAERRAANTTKQKYLENVREYCAKLDFRGILQVQKSMFQPLAEVFVPLRVVPESWSDEMIEELMRRARAKQLAKQLQEGVTDHDLRQQLEDELQALTALSQQPQPVDFRDMLVDTQRLVVLGDPGTGKTTLLRYLALTYAEGRDFVKERLKLDEERLPILVPIGAFAAALEKHSNWTLMDYLTHHFIHPPYSPQSKFDRLIEKELTGGNCVVLLDGLDEVVESSMRTLVKERVEEFTQEKEYSRNRFVVTSRILGYKEAPLGASFAHCTISNLEVHDIELFATKWCMAYESQRGESPDIRRQAEIETNRLITAIKGNPYVLALAENPLLLTIIALIHRKGTKLPNHRIELYALCAQTLIETWHEAHSLMLERGGSHLDVQKAFIIFTSLAFWMHENVPTGAITRQELEDEITELQKSIYCVPLDQARREAIRFLEMEEGQTGLLVKRGRDAYSFSHRTFEEYFAARAIASDRDKLCGRLDTHRHDPRWGEVVLLTLGQLGTMQFEMKAVTELMQHILDSPAPLEHILHRDLLLCGRCLSDEVGVSPPLQQLILKRLLEQWRKTEFGWLRKQIADILAAMRLTDCEQDVVQSLAEDLGHEDPKIRAIAAEALGRMGKVSALVLESLSHTLYDQRAQVRSNAARAIGQIGVVSKEHTDRLEQVLKTDKVVEVRRSAAEALVQLRSANPEALVMLLAALDYQSESDPEVRASAARAMTHLEEADEKIIAALTKALGDSRSDVSTHAAETLGKLGQKSRQVIDALVKTLADPRREETRMNAAQALGKLGVAEDQVVEPLIQRLGDDSYQVRKHTIAALGRLGKASEKVIEKLSEALTNPNKRIRVGAAYALGQAGKAGAKALDTAREHLTREGDVLERISTAEAVVSVDTNGEAGEFVMANLLDVLKPEYRQVGSVPLEAISYMFSEMAKRNTGMMKRLVNLLDRRQSRLARVCAAEALGKAGRTDKVVIEALLEALEDNDEYVRGNAAEALGRLGRVEGDVPQRLARRKIDPSIPVRFSAANALGKLGVRSGDVIDALCEQLSDTGRDPYHEKYVRDAAFEALQVLAPYDVDISSGRN